jgi:ATP dependent DNA ligase C terminal region
MIFRPERQRQPMQPPLDEHVDRPGPEPVADRVQRSRILPSGTDLARRLGPLRRATSPFSTSVPAQHARGAQWVEPRLVGEVAFTEWTGDLVVRHPSRCGLRVDKDPDELRPSQARRS